MLKETENVDMGVETEDVEASRASAIKAIDEAKGRIVESELKKLDAGQLAAKVVAEIPPDASGPAMDRLKQLGTLRGWKRIASRRAATTSPQCPARSWSAATRTWSCRFTISPTSAPPEPPSDAADDVEAAYNAILKLAATPMAASSPAISIARPISRPPAWCSSR